MSHTFGLSTSKKKQTAYLITIGKNMVGFRVSGLGGRSKGQDAILHNTPNPVIGNKLNGWKHNFGEKALGGGSIYDVIAPWHDLTR